MKHRFGLIPAILFCVGAALPQVAHADLYGTVVLDISRIALKRADGTPYSTTDFTHSSVSYYGGLQLWDGSKTVKVESDYGSPTTDLTATCIGPACPVSGDIDFEPLLVTPTGSYVSADQRQSGALLSNNLRMQTRADVGHNGQAYASSNLRFEFQLSEPGTMTIELDGTTFMNLWRPSAIESADGTAEIGTYIQLYIFNITTGEMVFSGWPNELVYRVANEPNSVAPYSRIYNLGLSTFSLSSDMLNASDTYEFSIYATSFSDVMNPVPEPSSLGMLGTGLVSLLALRWRRRFGRQRSDAA